MDKRLKIILFILLLPVGLIVLFYGGFAAMLIFFDQASYQGNEVYVGPIDYNSVLTNAEEAGYNISGSWIQLEGTNAIEPGNVETLDKRFGTDYLVHRVELYYNENTYFEFCKYENPETTVILHNYEHSDFSTPLEPSEFPEDSWMLEMFGLTLGLDEAGSRKFLERLKLDGAQQEWNAKLQTSESVDFPTVYTYLNQSSTETVFNSGMWNDEEFYRDGKKIGYVAYVVPESTISISHSFNKYSIDVSSTGFVSADILMHRASAGRKIPEEKYKAVFKEMFENLGLPVEKVDELEFEYDPSVW